MTLNLLKKNQKAILVEHQNDDDINMFLYEFGLLPGDNFKVIRPSVLGSPITIETVSGDRVAMRLEQAKLIRIKLDE